MIYVMLGYARSGGTILNKCLGAFDNVVMLSEVNPVDNGNNSVYGKMDAARQCRIWYNIDVKGQDFSEVISECSEYCNRNHKKLIIRDWSTVNFRRMEENNFNPPNRFLVLDELEKIDRLRIFTLVRNPIDVYISNLLDAVDLDGYLNFVESIKTLRNNKIIRYEDFCRSPEEILKELSDYIGLSYSDQWKSYSMNDKVNGDSVIRGGSRGARQVVISPLKRKRVPHKTICGINDSPEIKRMNTFLGYPSNYYEGAVIENVFNRVALYMNPSRWSEWVKFRMTKIVRHR